MKSNYYFRYDDKFHNGTVMDHCGWQHFGADMGKFYPQWHSGPGVVQFYTQWTLQWEFGVYGSDYSHCRVIHLSLSLYFNRKALNKQAGSIGRDTFCLLANYLLFLSKDSIVFIFPPVIWQVTYSSLPFYSFSKSSLEFVWLYYNLFPI